MNVKFELILIVIKEPLIFEANTNLLFNTTCNEIFKK